MFRFWRNMDDDDKSRLVRIIGLGRVGGGVHAAVNGLLFLHMEG